MTNDRAIAEVATPGPWEVDTIDNDGDYGNGPDDIHSGYKSFAIYEKDGGLLFDSLNRDNTATEIREDGPSEYGDFYAYDELAKRDFDFIAHFNPAKIIVMIAEIESLRAQVEIAREGLIKIRQDCEINKSTWGSWIAKRARKVLTNLSSSNVINRVKADALLEAARWFNDHVDNRIDTWQAETLRRMAVDLLKGGEETLAAMKEKQNG